MQKAIFLAMALTLLSTKAHATLFDNLKASFDKSAVPQTKELQGYWSGRCVESSLPDEMQPAIFIDKVIEDQHDFPPYRPTFTYFWKNHVNKALFDKATPQQIENDVDVKKWLAKEQWAKSEIKEGSLENIYTPSEKVSFRRSVRLFADEFNSTVMLRVIKITEGVSTLNTFCYFRKKLGGTDVTPPQGEYLIHNTGYVKNNFTTIGNPYPEANLRSLNILNTGTRAVNISTIRFFYKGMVVGQSVYSSNLVAGQLLVVTGPPQMPTFKMDRADFYVTGGTENLRITGVTNPQFPQPKGAEVIEIQ